MLDMVVRLTTYKNHLKESQKMKMSMVGGSARTEIQPSLFSLFLGDDFQDAEMVEVDTQIVLSDDSGMSFDPDELGSRRADKKTYVLPLPGTPGFQLLTKYHHLGLKILFALDTDIHVFTQEEVDRAIFEIDYRIRAMESLMKYEGDMAAVADLNAEIPGLAASILGDVSENSRWLDEDFRLLDKDSGITYHIKCKKLPKFLTSVNDTYTF
jgi:hypothetical protein